MNLIDGEDDGLYCASTRVLGSRKERIALYRRVRRLVNRKDRGRQSRFWRRRPGHRRMGGK